MRWAEQLCRPARVSIGSGDGRREFALPEVESSVTPQEQQLLVSLTQRINQTQLQEKDPDAENLLGRELGANPDAVYILAQTVLVQDIALQQAKAQVTQLQQQVQQVQQQPAHATSFLGRLLGEHDPQQAQLAPPPSQVQQPQAPSFQPVPGYQGPAQSYAPPQQFGSPQFVVPQAGQQPSFLRGAMQTAAGVAAGALAFEGVESILHGFGHGGYGPGLGMAGFGMGPGMGMGGAFNRPVDETVVNNYYDAPGVGGAPGAAGAPSAAGARGWEGSQGAGPLGDSVPNFGAANQPHFSESADQTGGQSGAQITDAGYNTGAGETAGTYDQGQFDPGMENASVTADTSADDVQIDDSGSGFDDGGSSDSGGGFDSSGSDGF